MSMHDLSSYKNLFLETAREYQEQLNDNLLILVNQKNDMQAITQAHLSAHSLKSECIAMGYTKLGTLCKTIEFLFYEIKKGKMLLKENLLLELRDASLQIARGLSAIESNNNESVELVESELALLTRHLESFLQI